VRIQIGSEALRAEARVVEGTERARLWQKLVTLSPGYAAYQKRTKRVIPLIALRRSG
jgi:proline iminopeptidase